MFPHSPGLSHEVFQTWRLKHHGREKKSRTEYYQKGSFKMLLEIKNMAEMKTEDEGHFLNSRATKEVYRKQIKILNENMERETQRW